MSQATLSPNPYRNSNLFSGRYLDEHVYELDEWDCDEEAREAFEAISDLYETRKDALSSYDEAPLRNIWIDEVLEALGYETLPETPLVDARGSIDRTLYETENDQMAAAVMKDDGEYTGMYGQSLSILEAKQWDADFTERFSDQRSYRDASHQIKSYLEHTPESVSWGILTNGKKWRLYGTKDYETETYYEVDLPELLESGSIEKFKYFYVLFRPGAFRESAGTTFLDTVWSESETAAQELGEDLQDNVFTALRVLGEGFVETNELDIDPNNDERLAELKEQSLVLLYRLMFVLYAESRDLIDPEDPTRRSEYEENFSLGVLRHDIREKVGETPGEAAFEREFSEYSFSMWNRLERLFALVDTGNDDLGIPPYNGGLFDEERHEFLTEHEVANTYIAEVIYRLSTTATDEGFVPADYADLDTRHLGTIYEGLLEHEFAVAPEAQAAVAENGGEVWQAASEVSVAEAVETVEKGELYVVNDDGERKATGAYYTPDYVVRYIVEETVGPLLSDIEAELAEMDMEPGTQEYVVAFWERVTDLKILDPAMGSGHFLTKATGYLAEAMMEQVRELETGRLFDEEQVRREISRECIYGVDINGMAVELAKLSMWLETLAADSPLAFLDHHLKTGNSLVGSDITEVLSSDDGETDAATEDEQTGMVQSSLFDYFDQVRRQALEHVMDLMGELLAIDNETLDDVHSMEDLYAEIRDDPLYGHLRAMANVYTASEFGLDVQADATEQLARAIEDEDDWADIEQTDWFRAAQTMSREKDFFHWELEFPEVFFDMDGERMDSAGFDAVVGNPPYVRQEQLSTAKNYFSTQYESYRSAADLYTYFIENVQQLLRTEGKLGYIISNKFIHAEYGDKLRSSLAEQTRIRQILDFHSLPVFSRSVSAYPLIILLDKIQPSVDHDTTVAKIQSLNFTDLHAEVSQYSYKISQKSLSEAQWRIQNQQISRIVGKIEKQSIPLSEYLNVPLYRGILTGLNEAFIISESEKKAIEPNDEHIRPLLKGQDIHRFRVGYSNRYLIRIPSGWTRQQSGKSNEEDAWKWFRSQYPQIADYLSNFQSRAEDRHDRGEFWWELRPCDYYDELENSKIVYPVISKGPNFAFDTEGYYINDKLYAIPTANHALLGVLNSTLAYFWVQAELSGLRGGYQEFRAVYVEKIPIKDEIADDEKLAELTEEAIRSRRSLDTLNLDLPDYLGTYRDGPTLGEMSYQPASGLSSSVLTETAESTAFETLRVTEARVEREGGVVRVLAVPYVKPTDEESYETNSRGYATLEPVPAMEFFDVDEAQAKLIETFVPYAVEEAGGFAGYRDNATKTNSPLDRLESLTLPALSNVEGGVERYVEAKERAAELDAKIERTDELIDEIVYELYGLTDEEIEIVEEAVAD